MIKRNGSPSEYEQRVKVAERYVSTAAKLPNVAAGEGKPADLDEWLVLAEVAHLRKWYATSAKLHAEFLLVDSPRVR